MARRPLERAVTIAREGGELALEGIFLAGEDADAAGVVMAPPHPLMGGSMDHPVVNEVAHACTGAGMASLRFNWRGVGASAGTPSGDPADAVADYLCATAYLGETVGGPLAAAGYSYGAATAVAAASREPRIRRLLLVAPPLAMLDRAALAGFRGAVLIVAARHDEFSAAGELEALCASLPRGTFHLVPDADHFFVAGLAEVSRAAAAWL